MTGVNEICFFSEKIILIYVKSRNVVHNQGQLFKFLCLCSIILFVVLGKLLQNYVYSFVRIII